MYTLLCFSTRCASPSCRHPQKNHLVFWNGFFELTCSCSAYRNRIVAWLSRLTYFPFFPCLSTVFIYLSTGSYWIPRVCLSCLSGELGAHLKGVVRRLRVVAAGACAAFQQDLLARVDAAAPSLELAWISKVRRAEELVPFSLQSPLKITNPEAGIISLFSVYLSCWGFEVL